MPISTRLTLGAAWNAALPRKTFARSGAKTRAMCGRFGSTKPYEELARRLGAKGAVAVFQPRFNIAPTQPVTALVNEADPTVRDLRWGLIPSWTADPAKLRGSFNARIESLASSPAYRSVFSTRRCAIFADGYYEWRTNGDGTKTPLWLSQRGGEPFVFAGVWDAWRSRTSGEIIRSCAIVTQPPNAFVAPVHSRMPVVLANEVVADWLAPQPCDAAALLRLLEPASGERWTAHEVSSRVGNVRNDDTELILPLTRGALQSM